MSLVRAGDLSISWLDAPVIARAMRTEVTFEQLCSEEEVPFRTVRSLYEAIGLARGRRHVPFQGSAGRRARRTGHGRERLSCRAAPEAHVHTGAVVFQDGDVYGRTVNLASRIASHATAGQVLASQETSGRASGAGVRFESIGPVTLKGVARPVELYQALRDPKSRSKG
jgi:class 3 adenylate cyclase